MCRSYWTQPHPSNTPDTRDAERLREITAYWSYWDSPPSPTIQRDVTLPARLSDSLALVVQGVRRCGKSTLLAQMIERYRLDARHCAFLSFEDPRLGHELDHSLLDAWGGVVSRRSSSPEEGVLTTPSTPACVEWP